jgi:hypothetical protein
MPPSRRRPEIAHATAIIEAFAAEPTQACCQSLEKWLIGRISFKRGAF